MQSVSENDVAPDIYSWHQIGSWEREPDLTVPDLNSLLEEYSLPQRSIDVNEYAAVEEQNPANSVYYLAQLERHNIRGLRANWGGGKELHDYMANLIANNGEYYPNGEWQLYKYYAGMAGERVATTASSDLQFDAFAVQSSKHVKVIAGTRTINAQYDIIVTGLTELGLPEEGSLDVHIYQFNWDGAEGKVDGAVDLGSTSYDYSSNTV
jgi:hypothetical protein